MLTSRPAFAAAGVAGVIAVVGFEWPYATELIAAIGGGLVAGMLTQRLLKEREPAV